MYEGADARTEDGSPLLARLDALIDLAAAVGRDVAGCGRWSRAHRADALTRLDRMAGALATVRAALLVAERAAPGSVGVGDRDFVAARARATRTGLGAARREVRQAEVLTVLPRVADAVGDGRVPLPHLEALAHVVEGAGGRAADEVRRPETQDRLVRLAERSSVREFAAAVARLVASFDPAGLEDAAAAQHRERFFVMSHRPEGTFLKGRLDHLSAQVLRTAIAAVGHAPDDDRMKAQADADALVALAERATVGTAGVRPRRTSASGSLVPDAEQDAADARVSGTSVRPAVSILVPAETFAELQSAQARRVARDGTRPDGLSPEERSSEVLSPDGQAARGGVEPASLEDGTPLAMSQLARVLCDSEVGRIVVSADGVPLDLGRTQRLYTGQQRRAVIVRDRGCAWNGCDVPAAYCDVHHIRWWDRHRGPTSVENGVLLCSHHHHVVHRYDLHVVRLGRAPGRAGPRSTSMLGEPCRYRFERRDGGVVSAPPGQRGDPASAVPGQPGARRAAPPGRSGAPPGLEQDDARLVAG